jgi:hypothetical protein
MRIASLHTYPVKGCHRLDHDDARVEPWGLAGDRRWLIVDPDGRAVTQRDSSLLTGVQPLPRDGGGLRLRAPGVPDLDVSLPTGTDRVPADVWGNVVAAVPAGPAADDWLTALLGRAVRLVWLADPTQRRVEPGASRDTDRVGFADGYPVLLGNAASLDALNDWLAESGDDPVPMTRFRPNVVVTGAPAWAEDDWIGRRLRIGEVTFRAAKACDRCVVTTIDQETGEKGRQPLFALGRHRRTGQGLLFALNLIPDGTGGIRVGDPVLTLA